MADSASRETRDSSGRAQWDVIWKPRTRPSHCRPRRPGHCNADCRRVANFARLRCRSAVAIPAALSDLRRASVSRRISLKARNRMSRLIIVVEKTSDWGSYYPSDNVVSAQDYLKQSLNDDDERTQVINLCRSYKYLGTGYYVSLLAEARGHKVIPSVRTINDLRRRSLYGLDIEDLSSQLGKFLPAGGRDTTDFGILVYFGETSHPALEDLARQVFDAFPSPILRIEFERDRVWQIAAIKPTGLHSLSDEQEDAFAQVLDRFSKKLWRKPRARRKYRFDLAMLVDPEESHAAVEQEGSQAVHRSRQRARHRSRSDRPQRLSAPGRIRRPVHPRDDRTRQPHLSLRQQGREGGHGRHRRSRVDPQVHEQDLHARPHAVAQAADSAHRDPLQGRSEEARGERRTPWLSARAEDSGWFVFARHRQGREARRTSRKRPMRCSSTPP